MKKILITLFVLSLLSTTSCNNDDDNNANNSLPPATQVGANTVGCLVNGEIFLPRAEGINPAVVVNYEFVDGEFFFRLTFRDQTGQGNESVNVRTAHIELEPNQTYTLNKNYNDDGDYTGGGGEYQTSSTNEFFTNLTNIGELTITRLDLSNSIISGTFWFDAINQDGEIVEIRDGRFDYVY